MMYKIIGADQREYGPVGADELRQWIAEGRANAQSRIQAEGAAEWRALASFSEFAAALGAVPALPPPLHSAAPDRDPASRMNRMAIAGFVCSVAGIPCCIGIPSLFGLVFSWVGLAQIRRHPRQTGKALAIAGIFISVLTLLLWVAIVVFIVTGISQGVDSMFSDQT